MEKKDGKLFHMADQAADLVLLGVIWFLTSLPVLTLGASCTALYYAVAKSVRGERGKPVREYVASWKRNAAQGCAASVIYLLFLAAVIVAGGKFGSVGAVVFLLVLTAGSAVYFFPVLSRFTLSVTNCFRVSVFLMIRHFPQTILLLFTLALCTAVFLIFPFLLPVLVASYVFYSTFLLEKILKEYRNPEKTESDEWYDRI